MATRKHRPLKISQRIGQMLYSRACKEQIDTQVVNEANESHRLRPEMQAFVEEVRRKWVESGDSQTHFADKLGIKNGQVHLNYLLRGRRGISFVKALRIANQLGIDLGELQRKFK